MGNDKASAPSEQTVTGCLQKGVEPVGFFIISADNKHWEVYSGKEVSLAGVAQGKRKAGSLACAPRV
jgi:hypothetical protein